MVTSFLVLSKCYKKYNDLKFMHIGIICGYFSEDCLNNNHVVYDKNRTELLLLKKLLVFKNVLMVSFPVALSVEDGKDSWFMWPGTMVIHLCKDYSNLEFIVYDNNRTELLLL